MTEDAESFASRLEDRTGAAFDKAYVESEIVAHVKARSVIDHVLTDVAVNPDLKAAIDEMRAAAATHLEQRAGGSPCPLDRRELDHRSELELRRRLELRRELALRRGLELTHRPTIPPFDQAMETQRIDVMHCRRSARCSQRAHRARSGTRLETDHETLPHLLPLLVSGRRRDDRNRRVVQRRARRRSAQTGHRALLPAERQRQGG